MSCLVVLIKCVGTPEHAVAVRTWIFLVSLMKLVFVSFPVKLPLELSVAAGVRVSNGNGLLGSLKSCTKEHDANAWLK